MNQSILAEGQEICFYFLDHFLKNMPLTVVYLIGSYQRPSDVLIIVVEAASWSAWNLVPVSMCLVLESGYEEMVSFQLSCFPRVVLLISGRHFCSG